MLLMLFYPSVHNNINSLVLCYLSESVIFQKNINSAH